MSTGTDIVCDFLEVFVVVDVSEAVEVGPAPIFSLEAELVDSLKTPGGGGGGGAEKRSVELADIIVAEYVGGAFIRSVFSKLFGSSMPGGGGGGENGFLSGNIVVEWEGGGFVRSGSKGTCEA
jgi:hypothetical protein